MDRTTLRAKCARRMQVKLGYIIHIGWARLLIQVQRTHNLVIRNFMLQENKDFEDAMFQDEQFFE